MDLSSYFSADYFTARERFRAAAARLGWQSEAHAIDVPGPGGGELTIDVAISAPANAKRCVVVSSGLHGGEGFLGSAVQLAFLEQMERPASAGVRLVFIHALNPYGFAWLRRADQENIDLNRNFLLPGEPYRGSPKDYARFDPVLNPACAPARPDMFLVKAMWAVARHGMPALRQSIVEGQYEFPKGLFYGGAAPAQTQRILAANLGRWLADCTDVVHIDFHTGLGKSATYKLLADTPFTALQRERLVSWFGADSFEEVDAQSVGYVSRGGLGGWCANQNPERDYLFVYAEFGTYGPLQVIAGLRAENQAHHWGRADDAATQRAKARMKELFCPRAARWRATVVTAGRALVNAAVDGCRE